MNKIMPNTEFAKQVFQEMGTNSAEFNQHAYLRDEKVFVAVLIKTVLQLSFTISIRMKKSFNKLCITPILSIETLKIFITVGAV